MSIHDIIIWPSQDLTKVCKPYVFGGAQADRKSDHLAAFLAHMDDVMEEAGGIGIAAPQIGWDCRAIAWDVDADKTDHSKGFLVNPEITWKSERVVDSIEGCLSLPGVTIKVPRHEAIRVVGYNAMGDKFDEFTATGILAFCIQHEVDHLDGKNITDVLTRLKKDIVAGKLRKWKRWNAQKSNKP